MNLQPYLIEVVFKPEVRPLDADNLARFVVDSIESRGEGAGGGTVTGALEAAIHRAIDKAVKVFQLVRADPEPAQETVAAEPDTPIEYYLRNGSAGWVCTRPPAKHRAHDRGLYPCSNCLAIPTPYGERTFRPVPEPKPETPRPECSGSCSEQHTYEYGCVMAHPFTAEAAAGIRPYCWCFGYRGHTDGPERPHRWAPTFGCPTDRPLSWQDHHATVADILANTACHCPAYGGDMHPWNPTGLCPSAAPRVGMEEPLPEQWSRDWFDFLERELSKVVNRNNVDSALDRPDWEIARRFMIEAAKMRRENRR